MERLAEQRVEGASRAIDREVPVGGVGDGRIAEGGDFDTIVVGVAERRVDGPEVVALA